MDDQIFLSNLQVRLLLLTKNEYPPARVSDSSVMHAALCDRSMLTSVLELNGIGNEFGVTGVEGVLVGHVAAVGDWAKEGAWQ